MKEHAGIGVSLEYSSVCGGCGWPQCAGSKDPQRTRCVDRPVRRARVTMERIGLEAGPLSQWLHAGMVKAGLCVELIETCHVRAAFKTMPVKTDKKDARGIAQLMRLGYCAASTSRSGRRRGALTRGASAS